MSESARATVSIALVAGGAWLVPWLGMRMLAPSVETSDRGAVTNYRGVRVTYVLGLVWVLWAVGLGLVGLVDEAWSSASGEPLLDVSVAMLPFVLVLGSLVFGLADDVWGGAAEKGFRGHVGALAHGRLTTGGLKLLGIGLLAAVSVTPALGVRPAEQAAEIGVWLLEIAGIALTANFVNLTDLRPGRALKAYGVLCVVAAALVAYGAGGLVAAYVLVMLLGPLAAVWRFDLTERGMLGDGGANAAGALAGWMIVSSLSAIPWALALYVVVVLALNIASERVSFSAVIEGNRALSWLDSLGRVRDGASSPEGGESRPHSETNDG